MVDTSSHPYPETAEKFCIECGQLIPNRATRCHHCSSYQDWRRHLSPWQTLLALAAAVVALVALVFTQFTEGAKWLREFSAGTGFDLHFGVTEIDEQSATILVTNKHEQPVILAKLSCQMFPIINWDEYYFGEKIRTRCANGLQEITQSGLSL